MKNFIIATTLLVAVTTANLIGFDLGNTFFKITLVKPGHPFSIVENTTSKRKTETMMTIADDQRLWSADAFTSASRYPITTFANVGGFLGKEFDKSELDQLRADWAIMNEFVSDERGLVAWQTLSLNGKEEKTIYYTEEVLGMLLKYGRTLSENMVEGAMVRDSVITIPSYFTQEQRRMVMDAAELAGLNVIQLVHENVAAATMFGIDRLDETPITVLFYNMGGVDTEVTIARFTALTDDKGKTYEHVEILAEAFDAKLGGQDFDKVIVDMMVDAFNAMPERKGKADVRTNDRAMKRLFKESIKVKDILSANKVADVKVPELVDFVTLRTLMERTDFDSKSAHLHQRVAIPVQVALDRAGLTLDDIDQVEILGGGLRVPHVAEQIKLATGKQELMVHLNGDEAMCFGSAFIAANSSSSFKVRKVYMTQHPMFEYRVEISQLEPTEVLDQDENSEITYKKEFTLFKTSDYLGAKKTIALSYDRNMKIDVYAVHPQTDEQHLATYIIDEIDSIAKNDIATKEGSTTPKLTLKFELTRSHLLQIEKAELKIEELVRTEVPQNKTEAKSETEETEETADVSESVEGAEMTSEEEVAPVEDVEPIFEEKIVPHSYPLFANETLHGCRLLTKENKKAAKDRIKALEKRDNDKYKTDEAKNTFESLIYEFRSWLNEDENQVYESKEQIEKLIEKCNSGEDWLYDAGDDVGFKEYQTKGYDLKADYSKLSVRKSEHQFRENQLRDVMTGLKEMKDALPSILDKKPWIAQDDGQDLADKIEEARTWLDDKVNQQAKLDLSEDPVFTADTVFQKIEKVTKLFKKITDKKKPKEKKPKIEKETINEEDQSKEEDL